MRLAAMSSFHALYGMSSLRASHVGFSTFSIAPGKKLFGTSAVFTFSSCAARNASSVSSAPCLTLILTCCFGTEFDVVSTVRAGPAPNCLVSYVGNGDVVDRMFRKSEYVRNCMVRYLVLDTFYKLFMAIIFINYKSYYTSLI